MAFWIPMLISLGLSLLAYVIMPKPKSGGQPQATKDLEAPVAEAGMPIPKVWGTVTIKGTNVLWSGDKGTRTFKARR